MRNLVPSEKTQKPIHQKLNTKKSQDINKRNPTNGRQMKTRAQRKNISRLQLKTVAKATTGHIAKTTVEVAVETTIRIYFHQNKELQNKNNDWKLKNKNIDNKETIQTLTTSTVDYKVVYLL